MSKRKPTAPPPPPTKSAHTAPTSNAPPPCPTCGAAEPIELRRDHRAGFLFFRYRCARCARVYIERDPPFPGRTRAADLAAN